MKVFADYDSSINPIDVPRKLIWDLDRRIAYFGSFYLSFVKINFQNKSVDKSKVLSEYAFLIFKFISGRHLGKKFKKVCL